MILPFLVAAVAVALATVSFFAPLPLPPPYQSNSVAANPFVGQIASLEGPLDVNTVLGDSERLFEGQVNSPETVVFDDEGSMYLFTETGIYKATAKGKGFSNPEIFVKTEGSRPLSGAFDSKGTLFFCDCFLGLAKVDMEERTYDIVLSSSILSFCDDVVISSEDEIFIADASSLSPPNREGILLASVAAIVGGIADGRLLKYTPSNGVLETLISNLTIANGVALSHDESFVLASDGGSAYRIQRYWLKGPKAGTVDSFIPSLPGGSDGVSRGSNGTYWVAIYSTVNAVQQAVFKSRLLRWAFLQVPLTVIGKIARYHCIVIQVDGNGQLLRSFHDPDNIHGQTTSVVERENQLFVGGLVPFVRRVDLKNISNH